MQLQLLPRPFYVCKYLEEFASELATATGRVPGTSGFEIRSVIRLGMKNVDFLFSVICTSCTVS